MSWFKSRKAKIEPEPGEHAEASENANGWVYRIAGSYGPDDRVPPEAVIGAWKVDAAGKITGDFMPNPNFDASSEAAQKR